MFFSAWGLSYDYHEAETGIYGLEDLPDFHLKDVGVWVEVRPQAERHMAPTLLDAYAPFVWHQGKILLMLFGPPQMRFPEAQGWVLQRRQNELVATPVHLTECPGCGGFRASGVGSASLRKQRPDFYHAIELRASTPQLQSAYEVARTPQLLLH